MILWFWSVLLAGGLPVLSSPFSNVQDDRHKHIRALSTLLESPICFTRSGSLLLFSDNHDHVHLYAIERLFEESKQVPRHAEEPKVKSDMDHFDRRKDSQAQNIHNRDSRTCGTNRNKTDSLQDGHLLMLMLTSGSTGTAKAVSFTHEQVLGAISGKAAIRTLPRDRPFLNWVGLDHVAGLLEIHLQALWLGVGQVHVSAADVVPSPETFLELLSRRGRKGSMTTIYT